MGIKVKAVISGIVLVVTGGALLWKKLKGEDERQRKICKMISDVDLKKEEEPIKEKTNEEIIDEALEAMDIGEDEMAQVTDGKTDILDKVLKDDEKLRPLAEHVGRMQNDPEYLEQITKEREAERQRRFDSGEWLEDVEKAKKDKNFCKLEDLFDEKYNPYPYHPAPATVYGYAISDGVIDEKLYNAAAKYFGRLWTYSGD